MAEIDPAHLHRPESEWPLLLAGPILRRVTATSVAVFVAVRDEYNVELHIHQTASPASTIVATTTNADEPPRVVKLGHKLFVSVMNVTGQFTPGHAQGHKDRIAGRHQGVNPQAPAGLNPDDDVARVVGEPGDQLVQPAVAFQALR